MSFFRKYQSSVLLLTLLAIWGGATGGILYHLAKTVDRNLSAVQASSRIIDAHRRVELLAARMLASRHGARYAESKAAALAALAELGTDDTAGAPGMNALRGALLGLAGTLEAGDAGASAAHDALVRAAAIAVQDEQARLDQHTRSLARARHDGRASLVAADALLIVLTLLLNALALRARARAIAAQDRARDIHRLASEGSNDGIFEWTLAPPGRAFYSDRFWTMLGYLPGRFPDTVQSFNDLLHPEDRDHVLEQAEKHAAGALPEYAAVFRLKHESGTWTWINARGRALYDASGAAVRLIGAHTDISHLKAYEEKLRQAKDAAESANRAKTDFLAHMSHEIRTPLTAISGIAEIFGNTPDAFDDKQKQLVKVLGASTASLKELISDILDFARIESGEVELDAQVFGLKNLFDQVIGIAALKAGEKSLGFSFDYDGVRQRKFLGDRARLRQILLNLIGNAIKFTETGAVAVTAQMDETADGPVLAVTVRDTGIGIASQHLDMIFERFKQADSSVARRHGGSGLGLPIALRLARLMGGDITVASAQGQGSSFTLTLPMKIQDTQDEDATDRKLGATLDDSIRAQEPERKNVLLVEDYAGDVAVLGYHLDSLHCRYDIARTGLEAVNMWRGGRYDLILMDVQMPEMDGLTATARIRHMEREENLPRTPVIGMTAHALVGDREKCIAAGMDAYLPKPIVETDLKAKLAEFLGTDRRAA